MHEVSELEVPAVLIDAQPSLLKKFGSAAVRLINLFEDESEPQTLTESPPIRIEPEETYEERGIYIDLAEARRTFRSNLKIVGGYMTFLSANSINIAVNHNMAGVCSIIVEPYLLVGGGVLTGFAVESYKSLIKTYTEAGPLLINSNELDHEKV